MAGHQSRGVERAVHIGAQGAQPLQGHLKEVRHGPETFGVLHRNILEGQK
jgi:hypothetical protein